MYLATWLALAPHGEVSHTWLWIGACIVGATLPRIAGALADTAPSPTCNPALWLNGYTERLRVGGGQVAALYTRGEPLPTTRYRRLTDCQWGEHKAERNGHGHRR